VDGTHLEANQYGPACFVLCFLAITTSQHLCSGTQQRLVSCSLQVWTEARQQSSHEDPVTRLVRGWVRLKVG